MHSRKYSKTANIYHILFHKRSTRYHLDRTALKAMEAEWKDVQPHYKPTEFPDKVIWSLNVFLRRATDIYFQDNYLRRAIMLETVASVPGMVAGVNLHLRSLRKLEPNQWIKQVWDEMDNQRMQLMCLMEIYKPSKFHRILMMLTQGVFFTWYMGLYLMSPRMAHRFMGYYGEESVITYTKFLKAIDAGKINNVPATELAKQYWQLPDDATLRDLIFVIRCDETDHRTINHFIADVKADKESDYFKNKSIHTEIQWDLIEKLKKDREEINLTNEKKERKPPRSGKGEDGTRSGAEW